VNFSLRFFLNCVFPFCSPLSRGSLVSMLLFKRPLYHHSRLTTLVFHLQDGLVPGVENFSPSVFSHFPKQSSRPPPCVKSNRESLGLRSYDQLFIAFRVGAITLCGNPRNSPSGGSRVFNFWHYCSPFSYIRLSIKSHKILRYTLEGLLLRDSTTLRAISK